MKKYATVTVLLAIVSLQYAQAAEVPESKGHFGAVLAAAFSPDGKKIVTAGYDNTARIWDIESGKELHILTGHRGHSAGINAVAFSPDGKIIVTGGSDTNWGPPRDPDGIGNIRIWDVETGTEIRKLEGYQGGVCSVAFSEDGKKVVAANAGKTVLIWDTDTGAISQTLDGHTDRVHSATFSSDGKKIVTSSWDNTARIWDAVSGKELKKFGGPTTEILTFGGRSVAAGIRPAVFSPDGKKVVAATCTFDVPGDNAILIWDAESGKVLQKWERDKKSQVLSIAFSPDGKKVAVAYRTILDDKMAWDTLIWDTESGKELLELPGIYPGGFIPGPYGMSAMFSPNGKTILTAYDNTVTIWDAESGKELKKWQWRIGYWIN